MAIQYIVSNIFKIQKRIIRNITKAGISDLCWDLFKELQILPFYSQHIYSLLMFVVKYRDLFKLDPYIHGLKARYVQDFHLPSAKLKLFQKGVFFNSGIKTYNHLAKTIKELSHDVKQFRLALTIFIISNSFYFWKSILTVTGNE
jgi:hypothetical protein